MASKQPAQPTGSPLRADYAVTAPADAERPRRRLPRPRWRTLILTLSALAVIAGALVVLNSPLLQIRSINVQGAQSLSAEALAQLTGLHGENILTADLGTARARLLDQPLVRDASLSRRWPNSVDVVIVERQPWARWQVGDEVWAIDDEGVVLEGREVGADTAIVRQVSSLPAIRGGARVDLDAVALIQHIQERGVPRGGPEILAFEWSLKEGLAVVTRHGRVRFGSSEGFEFKYAVWEQLEWEAQRRGEPVLAADLRFGTHPAVEMGFGLGRATRIVDP